jgi:hypothetical protein
VKHANKLAGFKFKLVFHAGLELELHTMDIVRATGDRNSSSSHNFSSRSGRSSGAYYRIDAFSPIVTLLRDNSSIAERVLCSLGCGGARGQVRKELSDRAKAEAWCGGRSLCAGAAESVAVAAEPVDVHWWGGRSILLIELLETALALLATPAEEEETKHEGETKDDAHCETSFCATGHAGLLRLGDRAVSGADRSASDHGRCVVRSFGTLGVSYLSGLDRRGCDVHGRGCSGWLVRRHGSLLSGT